MVSYESPHRAAFPSNLPSPPASSMAPSQHPSLLPQPRHTPLKPGGQKESELIRYLDRGVNRVQKRVDNRLTHRKAKPAADEPLGYSSFWEVAMDLEDLVDVVWVSGSPNLQIPYLLNLAVLTVEFLPMFDVSSRSAQAAFRLLGKLDFAFSSLLTGHDPATGEPLPGFEHGRSISTTDKVRLKGIVDRTRLTAVRALGRDTTVEELDDSTSPDPEKEAVLHTNGRQDTVHFEGFEDSFEDEDEERSEARNITTVYEKTIEELGDVLAGPPIGIITDDWAMTGTEQQHSSHGSAISDAGISL